MDDVERYHRAAHAVQSGVAMEMQRGSKATEPKHLRTGLDLRACDHTALTKLLVEKGVITEEEYVKAIADEAELEQHRYEERLSESTGVKVTLG